MIDELQLGDVMADEHVQTLDLTNFSGRIFFIADIYAHYSSLCHLLNSITSDSDEVVILSTGNLFDYGPEPLELITAIESNFFAARHIHFFSAAGAGELMLMKLLPENPDRRKFYPSTFENERWVSHGGSWHKNINRYYLEGLITRLKASQLPILLHAILPGSISVGVSASDYYPVRNSFQDTYNALKSFNNINITSFQGQFFYGMDHSITPKIIEGVNLMVLGRNPVNSIRKIHDKPLTNQPLIVGNSLHINTGSLDFDSNIRDSKMAPGISVEHNPAITLVELKTMNNPSIMSHQMTKLKNGLMNIKSTSLDIFSPDNHVMDQL
jgi:hypothetical protein